MPTKIREVKILAALTVISLYLSLTACERKQSTAECLKYPTQIDSLNIRDLYDSARLYLFTWLCDKKVDSYYRAQFELTYKSFFMRNDSIELFFSHSLPKELYDSTVVSKYVHRTSIAFNIKTKQKLWGWDINGFSDALQPGDTRFESFASPNVINFIRSHKDILNPCFLYLAKKNIIQEN